VDRLGVVSADGADLVGVVVGMIGVDLQPQADRVRGIVLGMGSAALQVVVVDPLEQIK
jgi:hypothetical protein